MGVVSAGSLTPMSELMPVPRMTGLRKVTAFSAMGVVISAGSMAYSGGEMAMPCGSGLRRSAVALSSSMGVVATAGSSACSCGTTSWLSIAVPTSDHEPLS